MKGTMKVRLKKDDLVKVISGKDKGKTGKILKIDTEKGKILVHEIPFFGCPHKFHGRKGIPHNSIKFPGFKYPFVVFQCHINVFSFRCICALKACIFLFFFYLMTSFYHQGSCQFRPC